MPLSGFSVLTLSNQHQGGDHVPYSEKRCQNVVFVAEEVAQNNNHIIKQANLK